MPITLQTVTKQLCKSKCAALQWQPCAHMILVQVHKCTDKSKSVCVHTPYIWCGIKNISQLLGSTG